MVIERPHLKFPFQRDPLTHKVQVVEQGTPEHIASQEWSVAMCPVGFRDERPDFGWPMPEMQNVPIDPTPLIEALDRLVPSSVRRTAKEYADLVDPSTRIIEVDTEVSET